MRLLAAIFSLAQVEKQEASSRSDDTVAGLDFILASLENRPQDFTHSGELNGDAGGRGGLNPELFPPAFLSFKCSPLKIPPVRET